MLTLKFYSVPVRLHDIINVVNQNALSYKQVSIIFTAKIWRHFSITSQLPKDPLCVTQLNYVIFKDCILYMVTDSKVWQKYWKQHTEIT